MLKEQLMVALLNATNGDVNETMEFCNKLQEVLNTENFKKYSIEVVAAGLKTYANSIDEAFVDAKIFSDLIASQISAKSSIVENEKPTNSKNKGGLIV